MDGKNCDNVSIFSEDKIVAEMSPVSPIIFTVLDTAYSIMPECVEVLKKRCAKSQQVPTRIYKSLAPSLMRALMQILLHSQDIRTQALFELNTNIDDLSDWECIILSNNGLAGISGGYHYRILKALNGQLPPPGWSRAKTDYYCQAHLQQSLMKLFPYDEPNNSQKPNVIYLWDSNSRSNVSLSLVCPEWGNVTKAKAYFNHALEHPILTIPNVNVEDIVEDIPIEKLNIELDIRPENEGKNDLW